MKKRPLLFNAFTMNCVMHINSTTWRHPRDTSLQYTSLRYWTEHWRRTLERGLFDGVFLADVLGVYDVYGGSPELAIKYGVQFPVNDPMMVVPAMAGVTEHLGFGITALLPYENPLTFARRMSTLDHLTPGGGWNIVTGYLKSAAQGTGTGDQAPTTPATSGRGVHGGHVPALGGELGGRRRRRRRAAVVTDPADPRSTTRGLLPLDAYHLCEPSPQRTPVLYQAGSSVTGRAFAARNAEATFLVAPTREIAAAHVEDIRNRAVAAGRRADDIVCVQAVTIVVGGTEEEAKRKYGGVDEDDQSRGAARAHEREHRRRPQRRRPEPTDRRPSDPTNTACREVQSLIDGPMRRRRRRSANWRSCSAAVCGLWAPRSRSPTKPQAWANVGVDGFNLMYTHDTRHVRGFCRLRRPGPAEAWANADRVPAGDTAREALSR